MHRSKERILHPLVANRRGLYCLWTRASEAENAPLVSVWVDPAMKGFETQMKAGEKDDAGRRTSAFVHTGACSRASTLHRVSPTRQVANGRKITGSVQDQTDAGIPDATVTVVNIAPRLECDLTGRGYELDNRTRIKLESKVDMTKRGLDSPDDADALALTFAQTVAAPSKDNSRPYRYQGTEWS